MANPNFILTVPSSTSYLEEVRHFIEVHAKAADFPESTVEQLKIAVDEACTNVIEHAYQGDPSQKIIIKVDVTQKAFKVLISDHGKTFNADFYQEPNLIEFAKTKKMGGFGVHIMRRLMDKVQYRKKGQTNECCLVKYRIKEQERADL